MALLGALALSDYNPLNAALPPPPATGTARVQILGVNDFHGHLQSPGDGERDGRRVALGGAAVLAAHLDRAQRTFHGATIRVHAGDMVGASPLVSSWFHDEPSVLALNRMRFDVGALGNHEFDEGTREMLRLVHGGHRDDGREYRTDGRGRRVDTSAPGFPGADFPYLAANVRTAGGRALLPPYRVVERDGVRVGFIGVVTPTTPTFLLHGIARGLRFADISDTVNRYSTELRHRGVRAIVVLAHAGAVENAAGTGASGEIVDETRQMSPDVDAVIAGHTHSPLNLRVPNPSGGGDKLVMQAYSFGTAYDRMFLDVDRATGEVTAKSGSLVRTWADQVRPDPPIARLVDRYAARVAPIGRRVVGRSLVRLRREGPGGTTLMRGRAALGAVAAAAQRRQAHADIGVVNPGNTRTDLPKGPITFADLFQCQAYGHRVLRLSLSGREVRELIEEQYSPAPEVPLHVSGLGWRRTGGRVYDLTLRGGRRIRPAGSYTVAANELIATGGRFKALYQGGHDPRPTGTDLDALASYVQSVGVLGR